LIVEYLLSYDHAHEKSKVQFLSFKDVNIDGRPLWDVKAEAKEKRNSGVTDNNPRAQEANIPRLALLLYVSMKTSDKTVTGTKDNAAIIVSSRVRGQE
jgi:hypothetical protein